MGHRRRMQIVAVIAFVTSLCGCGHSDEWQYGFDHADDAKGLISSGFSMESACRSIAGFGYGRTQGEINSKDAYEGCLSGLE